MAERTAEEWGRVAVSLPGWRLLPGVRLVSANGNQWRTCGDGQDVAADSRGMLDRGRIPDLSVPHVPDPDDPATAGCLLALLEPAGPRPYRRPGGLWAVATVPYMQTVGFHSLPLGRACIAAAEALGRWPGGDR